LRLKTYLKENWGAPFVIGFMLLLITSAVQLSIGQTDAANSVAVYAFYALVIGVALQIASYVKYGEGKPEPPEPAPRTTAPKRRSYPRVSHKVIAIAIIVVLAGVVVVGLYLPLRQTITQPFVPALVVNSGKPNVLSEPNGTTIVVLAASAQGGSSPYSFTCTWADGVQQTSTTGIFQRSFQPGQTVPSSALITAKSADGLTGSAKVTIGS
jgi:hypothetical protein